MHGLLGVELPLKQTSKIYDFKMVAYSYEIGVSDFVGDLRQVSQVK